MGYPGEDRGESHPSAHRHAYRGQPPRCGFRVGGPFAVHAGGPEPGLDENADAEYDSVRRVGDHVVADCLLGERETVDEGAEHCKAQG